MRVCASEREGRGGAEGLSGGIETGAGEKQTRFHWLFRRKLSQEEFERREREQRLSAADEKAVSAAEEIKTYK